MMDIIRVLETQILQFQAIATSDLNPKFSNLSKVFEKEINNNAKIASDANPHVEIERDQQGGRSWWRALAIGGQTI